MSDAPISAHDFIRRLRDAVPPIHPSARTSIDRHFNDIHVAVADKDTMAIATMAGRIVAKVCQELTWQSEDAMRAATGRLARALVDALTATDAAKPLEDGNV